VTSSLFLTFGGPGETPETVEETFRAIPKIPAVRTLVDHGFASSRTRSYGDSD